jgi:hypothetical protein
MAGVEELRDQGSREIVAQLGGGRVQLVVRHLASVPAPRLLWRRQNRLESAGAYQNE